MVSSIGSTGAMVVVFLFLAIGVTRFYFHRLPSFNSYMIVGMLGYRFALQMCL